MNTTTVPPAADSGGFLGSQNIGGFGYGIGISFGILLLIITITLASYYCTRSTQSSSSQSNHLRWRGSVGSMITTQPDSAHCVIDMGLDEATILTYPVVTYSDVKVKRKDSCSSCCSICLADYKGKDLLRQLPDCGHLFHVKCVDRWLRLNPTCPNCRTSPLPTPLSTPLAEVVPLTGRRDRWDLSYISYVNPTTLVGLTHLYSILALCFEIIYHYYKYAIYFKFCLVHISHHVNFFRINSYILMYVFWTMLSHKQCLWKPFHRSVLSLVIRASRSDYMEQSAKDVDVCLICYALVDLVNCKADGLITHVKVFKTLSYIFLSFFFLKYKVF